jgi:RNA polymerase sigma-70 factor (ECF subfamily)
MKENDQHILQLIQSPFTKEMGYRQLIETYQKRVYHVIRRMVVIHEDADDLTQNTFIKAFRSLDKFEGNSSLFTWLYRIATNDVFREKEKALFFLFRGPSGKNGILLRSTWGFNRGRNSKET